MGSATLTRAELEEVEAIARCAVARADVFSIEDEGSCGGPWFVSEIAALVRHGRSSEACERLRRLGFAPPAEIGSVEELRALTSRWFNELRVEWLRLRRPASLEVRRAAARRASALFRQRERRDQARTARLVRRACECPFRGLDEDEARVARASLRLDDAAAWLAETRAAVSDAVSVGDVRRARELIAQFCSWFGALVEIDASDLGEGDARDVVERLIIRFAHEQDRLWKLVTQRVDAALVAARARGAVARPGVRLAEETIEGLGRVFIFPRREFERSDAQGATARADHPGLNVWLADGGRARLRPPRHGTCMPRNTRPRARRRRVRTRRKARSPSGDAPPADLAAGSAAAAARRPATYSRARVAGCSAVEVAAVRP